jgi:hydroxymethylglutaryl-CoA lyase
MAVSRSDRSGWCSCWKALVFSTGIDIPALTESRKVLHAGLPAEALHGQVPKAGLPPTFGKAA